MKKNRDSQDTKQGFRLASDGKKQHPQGNLKNGMSPLMPDIHLTFEEDEEFKKDREQGKRKTKVINVVNKDGEYLAEIHWRTGWRRYVSCIENLEFDSACLREMADYLDKLMEARKQKPKMKLKIPVRNKSEKLSITR